MNTHQHYFRLLMLPMIVMALLACGETEILHDLTEAEANRVMAVLQQHGLAASKHLGNAETNTWTIAVPQQAASRAWSILAEYKLPHRGERRFQDVFGQSKLVVTPLEERALYAEALQGEIAHTLEAIDGVIDARVHLVLPQRDLSGKPMSQPKASVVLEYQPSSGGIEPLAEEQIRAIVAHAVGDLEINAVSVVQKATTMTASVTGPASGLELVSAGSWIFERQTLGRLRLLAVAVALFIGLLGALLLWQAHQLRRLRFAEQQHDSHNVQQALPAGAATEGQP